MAITQADIDALDAAILGTGAVQQMEVGGQSYTFRSVKEMMELRAILAAQLAAANGTGNFRLGAFSKGV